MVLESGFEMETAALCPSCDGCIAIPDVNSWGSDDVSLDCIACQETCVLSSNVFALY